jgi:D-amino peptidase
MDVLVSIDMEGCAGVVHVDQTRRTGADYERARVLMTREANAAALGAFDAGAARVVVNDSHADMRNLVFEELDPRVEVVSGSLKPLSMVQGLDGTGAAAALFVGYHGGAGTRASVLDHTYYGAVIAEIRLHPAGTPPDDAGVIVDEAAINALVLGENGVPLALVTGDEAVTAQARQRFPGVRTVAVKTSISRFSARSIHPDEAVKRIREGAREAVTAAAQGHLRPYRLPTPLGVTIALVNTAFADAAEIVPGFIRQDARTVHFEAASAREMLRAILTVTRVAAPEIV